MKNTKFITIFTLTFHFIFVYAQEFQDQVNHQKICEQQTLRSVDDEVTLHKRCLKEARKFKKKVFKNLLKSRQIGELVRVLLKNKKHFLKELDFELEQSLSLEITNLSENQVREYLLQKLRSMTNQDDLEDYELIFPLEIHIENEDGNICQLRMKSPPKLSVKRPSDCTYCTPVDIIETFSDDCSYFIGHDFSEIDALKLLGASYEDKSRYCHKKNLPLSDLSKIHHFGDKVCELLKKGDDVSQFLIASTRNQYKDKTSQLARKRGVFIRKYLYFYLTQKKSFCGISDEVPEWLRSERKFMKKFIDDELYHYEGNQSGDYGPNPYAKPHRAFQEIQLFEKHMDKFVNHYSKQVSDFQKDIQIRSSHVQELKDTFSILEKDYENLIFSEETVPVISEKASQISSQMIQINYQLNSERQVIANLLKKLSDSHDKYAFYQFEKNRKSQLMRAYYADPLKNKKEWDIKLFNDFKMAKISFVPILSDPVDDILKSFDPEVRKYFQALLRMRGYACQFKYSSRRPKF